MFMIINKGKSMLETLKLEMKNRIRGFKSEIHLYLAVKL